MKMKVIGMLAAFTLAWHPQRRLRSARKVDNVEVLDLDGNPAKLPHWGEKNLMIFYVDPDRHKQNNDFTIELEENHRRSGRQYFRLRRDEPQGRPDGSQRPARNMAKKRTARTARWCSPIRTAS